MLSKTASTIHTHSTSTAQGGPLAERRPQFEAALVRMTQRSVEPAPREKTPQSESFGSWFEAD
jgi:hypothetical protein